ncbi:DUF3097 domain-containing protein [Yonghaparkia sp. Root332]|uniref:DUF3097 domain-containing protein n=1 Tax=Yonghaparkia sp. Root332 TaxID=1736516 RepID=UPI0006F3C21B|nr:DUF3097 domain-containing protein [Yonghaparkia sp. Root332]KQV24627.1 hypothetical protein ASC54_08845 [Yonghaparkia sp. Root332]
MTASPLGSGSSDSYRDPYGGDVLGGDWRARGRVVVPEVPAEKDLVVELPDSGYVGAVVRVELGTVHLEDRHGRVRVFPLGAGFLVEGAPVILTAPAAAKPTGRQRTASGSFAVEQQRARVARGSRIWVEGRHDAELVEQVWGDDLRVEGVVVEYLEGVDDLAERLREFGPGPGRRVGVLVDHLVAGSKEERIAREALRGADARHVLVVGHPYIDIWQAVRPARVGIAAWPDVPRGEDWKTGTLRRLGWPHGSPEATAAGWRRIRGSVRSYADLDPVLLGRVEELIDFVTAEG